MPARNEPENMDVLYGEPAATPGESSTNHAAAKQDWWNRAIKEAAPVTLEEVLASWEARNPLKIKERNYDIFVSGPMNDHRQGLFWAPREDHLDMWRRSSTTRPEYERMQKPMSKQGEAVKRAGAINRAYILKMTVTAADNTYPVPLKLVASDPAIRGRDYTATTGKAWRALHTLRAENHCENYPDGYGKVVHKITMSEHLPEALALDNTSVEKLKSEVSPLVSHPGWLLVAGGLASDTCRILANTENIDALKQIEYDPDEALVQDLQHIGKVTVMQKKVFDTVCSAVARSKDEMDREMPSTDLTQLSFQFVPRSNKPDITMKNIEEHERFHNMSPKEMQAILNDGSRGCSVQMRIEYVLKDDVLERSLTKRS